MITNNRYCLSDLAELLQCISGNDLAEMFFVVCLCTCRIFLWLQVGADQMVYLIKFGYCVLPLMKDQVVVSFLRIFVQCIFALIKSL